MRAWGRALSSFPGRRLAIALYLLAGGPSPYVCYYMLSPSIFAHALQLFPEPACPPEPSGHVPAMESIDPMRCGRRAAAAGAARWENDHANLVI